MKEAEDETEEENKEDGAKVPDHSVEIDAFAVKGFGTGNTVVELKHSFNMEKITQELVTARNYS